MSNKIYRDVPLAPIFGLYDLCKWSFYRAVIAEFVATFLFLYTTILTMIGYKAQIDPDLASNVTACGGVWSLGIAFAFGGMYFILVYCTAGISNGHINPAVTWGMLVARKFSLLPAVFYMVAQCVGAICGTALVKALHGEYYNKYGGGTNSVSAGYSSSTGFCVEIMGTFILVYTVFSATDPKRIAKDSHIPVLSPLAIGFSVFMVHLATIPITGTGINPARSLGPAVIYNRHKPLNELWMFWVGPFIGATIAAFYHEVILRAKAVKAFGSICNC